MSNEPMLENVSCTCDQCERPLADDQAQLTMTTAGGTRRVYECSCGAITVTVTDETRLR
ncbi:hypothetical protein OB919_01695 [Halobacteria archaeon AArc-curdl1]|uniref:Uncharacterized protein n=1 Tax=Natronosalvus hydrolyticus TaxID=2979988 RepID=A0AAP3E4V7_9EURY|nr:hypothetical protein [Halobacteria archaeon AArc-curdl1]